MLIRSIDVRIRTRRAPVWNSSVLAEAQLQKTHEQKFVEMERDRGQIGSRINMLDILIYSFHFVRKHET